LILDYRSQIHTIGSVATPCSVVLPSVITGLPTITPQTCIGHSDTELHRWDLLANGYLDLGTWDGFTPYIGAGAGVSFGRTNQSVNYTFGNNLPCQSVCAIGGNVFSDFDSSQSSMTYRFAWALMAGVAIAMTDHAQLDVGYRFLDLGPITGISSITGTPVTKIIRANEVRAGVRYMID
jgi:opacity protein-like surface antigen